MRFENKADLERELGCIEFFCDTFGLTYKKLDENDIDYCLYKNGEVISYAEVKGRNKNLADAYPLPIACRKLVKLQDKRVNPVIIWACFDGIIYGKTKDIYGMVYTGGRKPRENSVNDIEFMAYFTKQSKLIEKYF